MRITGEAKSSEGTAAESELYASVISIDESKEEEKTLVFSSALTELFAESKENKQISGDGERIEKKEAEEKDINEGTFPADDTKKEVAVE